MIPGLGQFACLGILAGMATLVLRTLGVSAAALEQRGTVLFNGVSAGALRAAANLSLGLSCVFAVAACGELWLTLHEGEEQAGIQAPSAWGAMWVYVLALLLEWRWLGLSGAGRRALSALVLAGVGVMVVGIGLGAWPNLHPVSVEVCAEGKLVIDANAPAAAAIAALGLVLVPLGTFTLQGAVPTAPPLSGAAAAVVLVTWMQPVLPALGWLPLSVGAGAALAVLLVLALSVVALASGRGAGMAAAGLAAYFLLGVGGSVLLGLI